MRIRLLLLPVVIYLGMLLLTTGAMVLGTQTPAPILPLQPPDCVLPCLFGVTAGETSRQDAISRIMSLADFPIDQRDTDFSFRLTDDDGNATDGLLIWNAHDQIEYVRLYTRRWAGLGLRLGDILDGEDPSQVYRSCSTYYPFRLLMTFAGSPRVSLAVIADDHLSTYSPITMIEVSSNDAYFPQTLSSVFSGGCHALVRWQGFASRWIYTRETFSRPF